MGFVLIAGLLASCSGGTGGNGGAAGQADGQKTAAGAKPADSEPVELVFYSNGDNENTFNLRFGDDLRKKFPNTTFKFIEKKPGAGLSELLAEGTTIDVYYESIGGFISGLIGNNMQYDMTDLIKKHGVDLSRFEPTAIDAIKAISSGKLYALPVLGTGLGVYYDQDLFDKFGVPYLKDGMTWDDMLGVARKLTREVDGKPYIGLALSQVHWMRLNPLSLPYVDPKTDKAAINTDKWKEIFELGMLKPTESPIYKSVIQKRGNKVPSGTSFTDDRNLAIYIGLSDLFVHTELQKAFSEIKWDMVSMPTLKEAPGVGPQLYPIYFSVTSTGKHKDAAMEAIKYLTSDEIQMKLSRQGSMTVLKSTAIHQAYGQDSKFKDKNLKSVFYNKFAPIAPKTVYDAIAEKAYRKDIVNMIMGKIDINTAFRNAEEATNKAITEEKSK
jgi:multiple sugar transport system substrate-binding protein